MVRVHPDPPENQNLRKSDFGTGASVMEGPGAIAQLGERLLCKQEVTGSIPVGSTSFPVPSAKRAACVLGCRFCIGCSLKIRKK